MFSVQIPIETLTSGWDFRISSFWKCEVLTTKNPQQRMCNVNQHRHRGSNPQPSCLKQCAQPPCHWCSVLSKWVVEISLYIEATDYRSNLAKTILFESCSCFSKIRFSISVESSRIFQSLISIPAGHWVRQIDGKSSAIYLADSFCQHYSALWSAWQEDPNDPQERCAIMMARTSCARL